MAVVTRIAFIFGLIEIVISTTLREFNEECLMRHNFYRKKHGLQPLELDETAIHFAQKWANYLSRECEFKIDKKSPYGENVAGGDFTCTQAVDRWYNRKRIYEKSSPRSAGQFTQIVWKSSYFLGCGVAKHCEFKRVTVCYYFPPGNIIDHFK
ncbi:repressed by EFG1 protein 1-like isoform X2 [Dinothrombium tinctorium]|uniref:Repressed by EFG1 protein 1-like isoform X2 n=1 Tax=Dinothrombium tinctorium TaxID=1965070 RepID=A0A3S3P826_9ACAR|nr:repressed by EFG1 protein 1-like isoform X2 [Dinothrombium tinctorium]RWS07270.1 repressed by EFG1 protein 1-like isoform X2 [Dinothrombium tinctorium]